MNESVMVGGSISGSAEGEFPFPGSSDASLILASFSVYDAAGNLVPGTNVTPVLTPEPGTCSLFLCGALALCGAARAFSKSPSHGPEDHCSFGLKTMLGDAARARWTKS